MVLCHRTVLSTSRGGMTFTICHRRRTTLTAKICVSLWQPSPGQPWPAAHCRSASRRLGPRDVLSESMQLASRRQIQIPASLGNGHSPQSMHVQSARLVRRLWADASNRGYERRCRCMLQLGRPQPNTSARTSSYAFAVSVPTEKRSESEVAQEQCLIMTCGLDHCLARCWPR
jgi:hypothetical protein